MHSIWTSLKICRLVNTLCQVDRFKFEASADDKQKDTHMMKLITERIEKIVGKGEKWMLEILHKLVTRCCG